MRARVKNAAIVDAHHHLWRYDAAEFAWIDDRMGALRRDFGITELASAMATARVDKSVAVQARQSLAETDALLTAAREQPRIAGVVGWLPLADPDALGVALDLSGDRTRYPECSLTALFGVVRRSRKCS